MQTESRGGTASWHSIGIGIAAVCMIVFVAVAMIAIINDKGTIAAVCAVLGVSSHLVMWRLITHRKEALSPESTADRA